MAKCKYLSNMKLETENIDWKIQTLIDTAFPCGAFAHSQGLESAHQLGLIFDVKSLQKYVEANIAQLLKQFQGIFEQTHNHPESIEYTDCLTASLLSNHVARGASIRQGRAFAKASSQIFDIETIQGLWRQIDRKEINGHQVPVLAFILSQLGCAIMASKQYWLLMHAKSLYSAAVRLNAIGPTHSMRLLLSAEKATAEMLQASQGPSMPLSYSCQSSPILDITQAMQDRLYTKLFQS